MCNHINNRIGIKVKIRTFLLILKPLTKIVRIAKIPWKALPCLPENEEEAITHGTYTML